MNLARASDLSLFFQPFLTKLAICTNQLFLSNRHTSLLFSTPAFLFLPSMLSFLNHPFTATILNFLHTNYYHTTNFMVFLYNIVNTLKQHSSVVVILFSTFARFHIFSGTRLNAVLCKDCLENQIFYIKICFFSFFLF